MDQTRYRLPSRQAIEQLAGDSLGPECSSVTTTVGQKLGNEFVNSWEIADAFYSAVVENRAGLSAVCVQRVEAAIRAIVPKRNVDTVLVEWGKFREVLEGR